MKIVHVISAALSLAAATAVSAATITHSSSAAFMPNVQAGAYTESFADDDFDGDPSANFSGGGFAYTISAPGNLYGTGVFIGTNDPNQALTVTFTGAAVTAVGADFYATDEFDAFVGAPITLLLSDGTSETFTPGSVADSFRGFTSTVAITSLTVGAPGALLYSGLDNLTVGTAAPAAVPEPASWLLAGLSLGGVLLARRRKATA